VKFGFDVTREEAENQDMARELLRTTPYRVPRLYRYFEEKGPQDHPPRGYIVMEYIQGKAFTTTEDLQPIAQLLSDFSTIYGQSPGPFQKGISRGILWSESGSPCFSTVQEMEFWLNCRLPEQDSKLAFSKFPLIMCHLDIAPRNILQLPDGSLCLIDWATAGFYPKFFEVCMLRINSGEHEGFAESLLQSIEPLTKEEETQVGLLIRSFQNSLRYHFSPRMS